MLKKMTIPLLALIPIIIIGINGELDLVVSPKRNLPVITQVLESVGNRDFTILELPKLNHAFQSCETGSYAEYSKIEETTRL